MKIDTNNKSYKLASDVAELIKKLRITPHATTKTTPFDAHYWLKPNTPLGYICTLSKISNLSWENTKLLCLDEKILTKSALKPETIWKRDQNSEDELSLVYKNTYLPEPSFEPAVQTKTNQDRTSGNNERTSRKKNMSTPGHSLTT